MSEIELTFLGSGTSAGVPMIGCHCAVCSSADPHDKRTRPSVLIRTPGASVLVDTTPELRIQCLANRVEMVDAVVYTHGHADHIMGLDELRRFNVLRGGPLDVWADSRTHATLQRCFGYAFLGPDRDLKIFRPHLVPRTIDAPTPFRIGSTDWIPIPLMHMALPVLGFRVGRLAYCTDVNSIPEDSYPLLEGLEVLVLDALAPKSHPAHFSVEEAVEVSRRLKPRQTWFTHIGHFLGHESTNRTLPDNIRLAYDGLRVVARA